MSLEKFCLGRGCLDVLGKKDFPFQMTLPDCRIRASMMMSPSLVAAGRIEDRPPCGSTSDTRRPQGIGYGAADDRIFTPRP